MDTADDWTWPEEPQLSPYYVQNKVVAGEAPAPKPTPVKLPTKSAAAVRGGASRISDYSWSDDGAVVKVYVILRGLRREGVAVDIQEDSVEVRVDLGEEEGGVHVLHLQKLYDRVDVSASSHRVLEHKSKVILTLAKRGRREDGTTDYLSWPRLHFGASTAGAETVDLLSRRQSTMAAEKLPQLPQLSAAASRR